jgi:hypothetical protein
VEFEALEPDSILEKMYPKILKKQWSLEELMTGKE